MCEASSLNGCTPHSNGSLGVCAFGARFGWTGVTAELLGAEHLTGPLAALTGIGRNPERQQQQFAQGRPLDGGTRQAAGPDWRRRLGGATEQAFPSQSVAFLVTADTRCTYMTRTQNLNLKPLPGVATENLKYQICKYI